MVQEGTARGGGESCEVKKRHVFGGAGTETSGEEGKNTSGGQPVLKTVRK